MYIATFFSYYGAMLFKHYCETEGWAAKMMPVPRQLSSSCGTCIAFNTTTVEVESCIDKDLELKDELAAIYRVELHEAVGTESFKESDAHNYVLLYSCDH